VGPSIGLLQAVGSPLFFRLYVGCLLAAFAVFVPFVHLAPSAISQDIGAEAAGWLVALIGVGSTAGRFALGGLADRIGRLRFLGLTYLGMALAMALWAIGSNFHALAAFALIFGVFYGAWVAILPPVVMDGFGGANVGGIIGVLYSSVAIGTLVGPVAAGYAFDASGSYLTPILGGIAGNLAAALLTYSAARVGRSAQR
jgi:predicted MFS family arabinose efflux permease